MRTHLEFASTVFPPYPSEDEETNPGVHGKRLAEFLAEQLPQYGFRAAGLIAEDWGWCVMLENDAFPLWIGCANLDDGYLCMIHPSKPVVRRWFTKVSAEDVVERLASALQTILEKSGKAERLRWWTEDDAQV